MKTAVIISGGRIDEDFALDFLYGGSLYDKKEAGEPLSAPGRAGRLVAAADSGADFLYRHGIAPDMAIGDFDSISREAMEWLCRLEEAGQTKVVRLRPEKDDSDTQAAVTYLHREGFDTFWLLGCTGSRLDHVMANIGLMLWGEEMGCHLVLVDEHNRAELVSKDQTIEREELFGPNISFFALDGPVEGLTLSGFYYPLEDYALSLSDAGLTLSNKMAGGERQAHVSFRSGRLLMIQARD